MDRFEYINVFDEFQESPFGQQILEKLNGIENKN